MNHIVTVQDAVTAFAPWIEPTNAELDAIEQEMPVILADVDLLEAHIATLDRTPTELDERRIRRARRRALAARVALVNRAAGTSLPGGAA
jgi:septal ring factor EnvC (AmiA/AmiB activator)